MAALFDTMLELNRLFIIPETGEGVDEETGEILSAEYINSLQMKKEDITKYLAQEVLNAEADAKAYKEQKAIFAEKQKRAENRSASLRSYLSICLAGEPFEAEDKSVKITYRKSDAVNITDESIVPRDFLKVKTEADKTAIKKAIKEGKTIPGAELVSNNNMQIK